MSILLDQTCTLSCIRTLPSCQNMSHKMYKFTKESPVMCMHHALCCACTSLYTSLLSCCIDVYFTVAVTLQACVLYSCCHAWCHKCTLQLPSYLYLQVYFTQNLPPCCRCSSTTYRTTLCSCSAASERTLRCWTVLTSSRRSCCPPSWATSSTTRAPSSVTSCVRVPSARSRASASCAYSPPRPILWRSSSQTGDRGSFWGRQCMCF